MKDVIIIGGGPAGMSAAIYALRASKSVLLIEKDSFGGQIATSPRVENLPSIKSISGIDFANEFYDQITDLGVEFELEDVESVEKRGDIFVIKTNYGEHEARSVIIANGLKHRHTGLESETRLAGKGVSYCATCDGAFFKGQNCLVIGDGNTAVQYAILLAGYCKKVTIVTLFDKFFADNVLVKRMEEKENIEFFHNYSVQEFVGDNQLSSIRFKDTKTGDERTFEADGCFVAIGQIPNNDAFKNLVDLDKGFIVTDELMQTKTPGIYAAGDTRVKQYRQVVTAVNDGAIAAMSAIKYLG